MNVCLPLTSDWKNRRNAGRPQLLAQILSYLVLASLLCTWSTREIWKALPKNSLCPDVKLIQTKIIFGVLLCMSVWTFLDLVYDLLSQWSEKLAKRILRLPFYKPFASSMSSTFDLLTRPGSNCPVKARATGLRAHRVRKPIEPDIRHQTR